MTTWANRRNLHCGASFRRLDLQAMKLTPKQAQAVQLLVCGHTVAEVARRLGVAERTLYAWRAKPEFQQAEAEAHAEAWRVLLHRLGALATEAVAALERAMSEAPQPVRVRAALGLLDKLIAVRQAHELEQRLAALERELNRLQEVTNDES